MSQWAREHPDQDYDAHFDALRDEADRTKHERPRQVVSLNSENRCGNCGRICIGEFCRHCLDLERMP